MWRIAAKAVRCRRNLVQGIRLLPQRPRHQNVDLERQRIIDERERPLVRFVVASTNNPGPRRGEHQLIRVNIVSDLTMRRVVDDAPLPPDSSELAPAFAGT